MKLFRKKKRIIKLLYDDNVEDYLQSIGYLSQIINGKIQCKYCGEEITIENLEAIYPSEDDIEFICSRDLCLTQVKNNS